jgi:hypothetical protein
MRSIEDKTAGFDYHPPLERREKSANAPLRQVFVHRKSVCTMGNRFGEAETSQKRFAWLALLVDEQAELGGSTNPPI